LRGGTIVALALVTLIANVALALIALPRTLALALAQCRWPLPASEALGKRTRHGRLVHQQRLPINALHSAISFVAGPFFALALACTVPLADTLPAAVASTLPVADTLADTLPVAVASTLPVADTLADTLPVAVASTLCGSYARRGQGQASRGH